MRNYAKYLLGMGIVWFALTLSQAQYPEDALRFSREIPGGTARNIGLAGAFGALGGDFGSLSINPAGVAMYQGNEITFSPTVLRNVATSDYLDSKKTDYADGFNFNNLGFVSSIKSGEENGWVNVGIGIGYNRTNNYNQRALINAIPDQTSMVDEFFSNIYGSDGNLLHPDDLATFYERLAFDAYVIDTVESPAYEYISDVPFGVEQRHVLTSSGRSREVLFSFGANYNHKLYIGGSFTISKINYNRDITHTERDVDNLSQGFDYFTFNEELESTGKGYSFKLGAIYKPIKALRLGMSVDLPTRYDMTDEFYNTMQSNYVNQTIYPTTQNGTKLDRGEYEYILTTPYDITGSVAFQFQKLGLISLDVERVDYSTMRLMDGGDGYDFFDENEDIKNNFQTTYNIRAGGEIRLAPLYLRGGYLYYPSPYKNKEISITRGVSGGIGYREQGFFLDLSVLSMQYSKDYYMYNHEDLQAANLSFENVKVVTTLGFRF